MMFRNWTFDFWRKQGIDSLEEQAFVASGNQTPGRTDMKPNDRNQILAQIRRRDEMYPDVELTSGAVLDRRTLLHIIDELQKEVEQLNAEANFWANR